MHLFLDDNIKTATDFIEIICQHVFESTLKKSVMDQCCSLSFIQQVASFADQTNESVNPLAYLELENKTKLIAMGEAKEASDEAWRVMMHDFESFQPRHKGNYRIDQRLILIDKLSVAEESYE